MESLWHVKADTPEELRQEFLRWLESRKDISAAAAENARTKREMAAANARRAAYGSAEQFWRDVIIDPKEKEPQ